MLNLRFVLLIFAVGLTLLAGVVCGQSYPTKPIRIITSPAGGGSDQVARLIAQGISGPLGQQVIVDNQPSALVGEIVARATPDGYTLLVHGGTIWLQPLLRKMAYDPVRDLSPVTLATLTPNLVVVHPSLPVRSVKELIALAKVRPGELNYAATGTGGSSHLSGELFKAMAGVNIMHINYKGVAPAVISLLGGEIQMMFPVASSVMPHVQSGRLKALAVTSAQPSALTPGLPTVAASGVPGYESVTFNEVFAPAKTPEAIINRLNQEIVRLLKTPEAKKTFFNSGAESVGSSPEELAATMRSEMAKMGKVIKDAGIRAE